MREKPIKDGINREESEQFAGPAQAASEHKRSGRAEQDEESFGITSNFAQYQVDKKITGPRNTCHLLSRQENIYYCNHREDRNSDSY